MNFSKAILTTKILSSNYCLKGLGLGATSGTIKFLPMSGTSSLFIGKLYFGKCILVLWLTAQMILQTFILVLLNTPNYSFVPPTNGHDVAANKRSEICQVPKYIYTLNKIQANKLPPSSNTNKMHLQPWPIRKGTCRPSRVTGTSEPSCCLFLTSVVRLFKNLIIH